MKKNLIVFLSLVMILASSTDIVFAGGGKRNGTAGAQELLIPVGARGLALNGSYVSGISGAEAIYYNPAGLNAGSDNVEVLFSQMTYIADINVSYAAVAAKFGDLGSMALSIKSLNFGDINTTTEENPQGDGTTFSPNFVTIGLTYANNLTDNIKIGATAKLITEKIVRVGATGFALDAGVQYSSFAGIEGLSLGVALKNLGPQMSFDGPDLLRMATDASASRGVQFYQIDAAGFDLPSQLEIGMAYAGELAQDVHGLITTTYQDNNFLNDEYKIGSELCFMNSFYVRGGYTYVPQSKTEDDLPFGPTFGAGLKVDSGVKIIVDYGYRSSKLFGGNNVFSIKIGF